MAKASRVLAARNRDGWREVRRRGSHRRLERGDRARGTFQAITFAYHDSVDRGTVDLARIGADAGYTLAQLRRRI